MFAAPRSEGIWDEVREEIRSSLSADGVAAQEVDGEYGIELRARVRTADGGLTDMRFVGIDGPRWMVRGAVPGSGGHRSGRGRHRSCECLSGLVVDRGDEARPVREPLPLRLPRGAAEQALAEEPTTDVPITPTTNGAKPPATPPPSSGRRPSPRPRR